MRRLLTLPLLLVLVAFASACGSSDSTETSSASTAGGTASGGTIRVGHFAKAVDYAPALVAKEKGWWDEEFAEDGVTIDFQEFQSAPAMTEAFGSDRVDVVFMAEIPAMIVQAADIDVQVPRITSELPVTILVAPDSPIQSVADLKGKKIGVLTGSAEHYGLVKVLEEAGIKGDAEIINMDPADGKAAFESGQIDAWAIWPPFVELEETAGTGRVLPGTEGTKMYSIETDRTKWVEENPEVAARFHAVLDRAREWIAEHPDEAQQIVADQLDFPIDVIAAAWKRNNFDAEVTEALLPDFQGKADFLKDQGFVSRRVDVEKEGLLAPDAP
jgi:sulfonate transport system substrate-binding protein